MRRTTQLMKNRLAKIRFKYSICIICEGNEEFQYLERLCQLKVFNGQYRFSLVNAAGHGNLSAFYQDRYQSGTFDLVLIFCDTEKKPFKQYEELKHKIDVFHGVTHAAEEVILFGNPCTMQIIIKHWTDTMIKTPAKKMNSELIMKYTGVEGYKGKTDQIAGVMEHITAENFREMTERIAKACTNDNALGSTNAALFFERFISNDSHWITHINDVLERTESETEK